MGGGHGSGDGGGDGEWGWGWRWRNGVINGGVGSWWVGVSSGLVSKGVMVCI